MIITFSIFYSILRYRFLDIRILTGRILYYLILSVFIFGFYYTAYFLNQQLFGTSVGVGSVLIGIPLAIIFIIFYSAATKFIQTQIDSTLISPDYDPAEVIADFNKEVSTTLDYENIANKAIAIFARTLRSTYEGIVTIHDGSGEEIIQGKKSLANITEITERTSKLWDTKGKFTINYDLFELEFPQNYKDVETELRALMEEMQKGAMKLIVPLGQREEMLGMVLIGQKEADAPYNSVELGFITSIADLTGLGLARAFLYREVQEFNNTLQQKVNQATQEIQDKNAKLEEALRNERDMLDILGHELRTPLGTARNAIVVLETLIEKKELTEENLKKYITISAENIRREVQLLETILASTKVDNDKLELKLENINAQEIVEASLQTYAEDAEKKGLMLKKELPAEPLECYADKVRIQQIMDNLTSNAIKYTQSGSVTLKLEETEGTVVFSVIDTGEGIPQKEIPNLGRKFYRINNYLSSKGKLGDRQIVRPGGTGIGLYVVFQLVKAMKGRVEIQSKVGQGSTFSFELPKAGLI